MAENRFDHFLELMIKLTNTNFACSSTRKNTNSTKLQINDFWNIALRWHKKGKTFSSYPIHPFKKKKLSLNKNQSRLRQLYIPSPISLTRRCVFFFFFYSFLFFSNFWCYLENILFITLRFNMVEEKFDINKYKIYTMDKNFLLFLSQNMQRNGCWEINKYK